MTLASFTDTPPLGVHWPFYLWLIDFLTLSTCGGPGCKRYIVLVTYLFPSIHFPARVLAEAKICEDIQTQTDDPPPPQTHTSPIPIHKHTYAQHHTCTQKPHFTCFFPAPKDRSSTAVTGEVMRLGGGSDWADSERAQHRVTGHSQQP